MAKSRERKAAARPRSRGAGAGAPGGRWPGARRNAALAALLLAAAVLLVARISPELSTIGDNAEYVVIAESILNGHGLAHESDPALKPQTKYPPVYPALLAPIVALAPGRVVPLKMLSVACGLVAVWLTFLLVEARGGTLMALLIALLTALNSNFLNFSQEVLAEIPYLAMTLAALWFLAKGGRGVWIALALAALASNTRTVGLGLGIAVFLHHLLVRRYRAGAVWFAVFLAANLPWFIRNRLLGTAGTYAEQLMMKNPYRPWLGTIGPGDLVTRIRDNITIYVQRVMPELFHAPVWQLPEESQVAAGFLGIAVTALVLLGIAIHLRRGPGVLEIYVLFFAATCVIWPQVWSSVRFLVPVLPLLLYFAVEGGRGVAAWLGARSPGFSSKPVMAGAILTLLGFAAADAAKGMAAPRGLTPDWVSYYAAADWVRESTPRESVIACRSTYLFYLRAHRKTVGYVFSEKPDEVLKSLSDQHATHVVVDGFMWTNTTARYLIPALQSRQDLFVPVHQTADPPSWVLEMRPAAAGEAPAPGGARR